jgi:hypothetical protein
VRFKRTLLGIVAVSCCVTFVVFMPGCMPSSSKHEVTVRIPELPATADKLGDAGERTATKIDPGDFRGRRLADEKRVQEIRDKDQRIRELEDKSKPIAGAQLKILVGGLNHIVNEPGNDNYHFNESGIEYNVPFTAPNEILDIQLLPRQVGDWKKLDETRVIIQPDRKSAKYFFRGSRPAMVEFYAVIVYR